MKKTLVLKMEYLDIKGLSKETIASKRKELFKQAIDELKNQLQETCKVFKIVKERPEEAEIEIEFIEVVWDKLYSELLKADVVALIDSFIYES